VAAQRFDPLYRKLINLIHAIQGMGRPYIAPPGIPQDRVKMLRDAF